MSGDRTRIREVLLNLLLNIGPRPDGAVPEGASQRLVPVGHWIAQNGEALYGRVERTAERMEWGATGEWTIKGNMAYYGCHRWPGREPVIAGPQNPGAARITAGDRRDPRVRAEQKPAAAPRSVGDQPGHPRGSSCHQA